jgi:exosortase A-associated hydrolase 1
LKFTEEALQFSCADDVLVGVLAAPAEGTLARTGVVVIVGGPQVRAGSHRQFTLLARYLAAEGYPVLRFDVRGMGDSSGEQRSFQGLDDDIGAAVDTLMRCQPNIEKVVLWGLCDGASAALLYVHSTSDARVAGLCLVNPWVRSEASLARTHVKHYYIRRLMQGSFWRKLLGGGVAGQALSDLRRNLRLARSRQPAKEGMQAPFQRRMALGWAAFDGPALLLLSGNDYTAREFCEYTDNDPLWRAALAQPNLTRHDVPDADHTFSDPQDRQRLEATTLDWLNSEFTLLSQAANAHDFVHVHSSDHA